MFLYGDKDICRFSHLHHCTFENDIFIVMFFSELCWNSLRKTPKNYLRSLYSTLSGNIKVCGLIFLMNLLILLRVMVGNFFVEFYRAFDVKIQLAPLEKPDLITKRKFSYWANIYLFKVINKNSRKWCEIWSKLTIKTPNRYLWCCSSVFAAKFEQISPLFLAFLLLNLNKRMFAG